MLHDIRLAQTHSPISFAHFDRFRAVVGPELPYNTVTQHLSTVFYVRKTFSRIGAPEYHLEFRLDSLKSGGSIPSVVGQWSVKNRLRTALESPNLREADPDQ